jgi:hypothetical protein
VGPLPHLSFMTRIKLRRSAESIVYTWKTMGPLSSAKKPATYTTSWFGQVMKYSSGLTSEL